MIDLGTIVGMPANNIIPRVNASVRMMTSAVLFDLKIIDIRKRNAMHRNAKVNSVPTPNFHMKRAERNVSEMINLQFCLKVNIASIVPAVIF